MIVCIPINRLRAFLPEELAALPKIIALTRGQSTGISTSRLTALLIKIHSINSVVAALLALFALNLAQPQASHPHLLSASGESPSNELVLSPQGFSFVEQRRLNTDNGNHPDADKYATLTANDTYFSLNSQPHPAGFSYTFDQRLRHFCNALNPRAPPLLS